jgi:hypothetical protein
MSSIAKVIKIVSLPHGDAPDWVRQAWVGCILPCEPECGHVPVYVQSVLPKPPEKGGHRPGVEFFNKLKEPNQKVAGFSVDTKLALDVLRKKSPTAAKWFYDRGYPMDGKAFRFRADEAKVIEFVPDGRGGTIVRYDDMETGSMRPLV